MQRPRSHVHSPIAHQRKHTDSKDNTTRNSPARQTPPTWQATSRTRPRTRTRATRGTRSTLRARRGAARLSRRSGRARPWRPAGLVAAGGGATWAFVLEREGRELERCLEVMGEGGEVFSFGGGGGGGRRTLVALVRGVCGLSEGGVLRGHVAV